MSAASLARRKVKALRRRGKKAWAAAAGDTLLGTIAHSAPQQGGGLRG